MFVGAPEKVPVHGGAMQKLFYVGERHEELIVHGAPPRIKCDMAGCNVCAHHMNWKFW